MTAIMPMVNGCWLSGSTSYQTHRHRSAAVRRTGRRRALAHHVAPGDNQLLLHILWGCLGLWNLLGALNIGRFQQVLHLDVQLLLGGDLVQHGFHNLFRWKCTMKHRLELRQGPLHHHCIVDRSVAGRRSLPWLVPQTEGTNLAAGLGAVHGHVVGEARGSRG